MSEVKSSLMMNEVVAIESGIQDDCRVTFKCNGRLFEILLAIGSPNGSIEREYLRRLDDPLKSKDEERVEEIYDELIDLLATLCQPFFKEFAGAQHSQCLYPALYHLLYFEVVRLCLRTAQGKAELQLEDVPHLSIPNNFYLRNSNQPCFLPSKIEVLLTLKQETVFKVSIQGSTMCAKVVGYRNYTRSLQREIDILQRVSEAKSNLQLHVPTLLGLIVLEEDTNQVIGFLMEYIRPGPSTSELISLNIDSISLERRNVWGNCVNDELKCLH